MSQYAVDQTLSMYAHAIDAVDLTKRAVLDASRSWVKATERALGSPGDQDGPWALVDIGFDSAALYVTVQTRVAKRLLEATAEVVGASLQPVEPSAPTVTIAETVAVSPQPVEPSDPTVAIAEAPRAPKPAKRAGTKSPAPTTPSTPKGASPSRPSAGTPRDGLEKGGRR